MGNEDVASVIGEERLACEGHDVMFLGIDGGGMVVAEEVAVEESVCHV